MSMPRSKSSQPFGGSLWVWENPGVLMNIMVNWHTHTQHADGNKWCSLFARYHQAEASKLKHSVNALGTVVEGPAAKVWSVCRTVIWDEEWFRIVESYWKLSLTLTTAGDTEQLVFWAWGFRFGICLVSLRFLDMYLDVFSVVSKC